MEIVAVDATSGKKRNEVSVSIAPRSGNGFDVLLESTTHAGVMSVMSHEVVATFVVHRFVIFFSRRSRRVVGSVPDDAMCKSFEQKLGLLFLQTTISMRNVSNEVME